MKTQNEARRPSGAKRLFFWLTTMMLSLLTALLVGELTVRLVSPQQETMQWFLSSERYGFVMRPNFHQRYRYIHSGFAMEVRTNSLGLRDEEYDFTSPDRRRVLLLGDSFTFGYGVNAEDNFDAKLEALLRASGQTWDVINAGHGGWGTLQETLYARDHLGLFKPDVIVITFCGNDPEDDFLFSHQMKDSERGVLYFPGKVFLRNHSHLYRFLFQSYSLALHNWVIRRKLQQAAGQPRSLSLDEQSASVITEEEWDRTLGYLRAFQEDFRGFKPDGVLLIQASAPLNADVREHLRSLSDGETLVYVDLYNSVLRLKPSQRRLPHDGHWSPLMHSISARALFETIAKLGYLGKRRPAS